MGNCTSSGGGGSGGGSLYVTERATRVTVQSGDTLDLTNTPLTYTVNDSTLTGEQRAAIETWERKRGKAKIEYAYVIDENGNMIVENKGGRGSVRTSVYDKIKGETFSHIHPRGKGQEGYLGGTFSLGDIQNFTAVTNRELLPQSKMRSYRAKAAEGTYYIRVGKNYDPKGLRQYAARLDKTFKENVKSRHSALTERYKKKEMDWLTYDKEWKRVFNEEMINLHNSFLAGQKTYGYTYGLERSK